MTVRKIPDALRFTHQYFKIILTKIRINITRFHDQILRTLAFSGVDINFRATLIEILMFGLLVNRYLSQLLFEN